MSDTEQTKGSILETNFSFDRNTLRGQIIFNTIDEKHYRILYLPQEHTDGCGYWICVDSKTNIPQAFKVKELEERIRASIYRTVYDEYLVSLSDKISAKNRSKMESNYALIAGIVGCEPEIYDRNIRREMLNKIARENNKSGENLYTYLGRYWRGGMTKAALQPNYSKNGTYRKKDFVPSQKLGRKGHAGNRGKILTKEDYENFDKIIQKLYLSTTKPSLTEVYDNMLTDCYQHIKEEDGSIRARHQDEKPSYMQFYYWYQKNRDIVAEQKARKGEGKFNLQNRAITGHTENFVVGPGMAVQIDATIADYYLVKADDRNALIGRPVVFFVRDAWSRMITGMYVTLNNPSWDCALMALKNVAEDKVEFCRRYGVEITPEEWPCHHLPNLIVGDNGEMADKGVEDKIRQLGITIQNTPPYRGDLKAIIENVFNLINIRLHYIALGHVEKDADTRGAIDRRKEACLDLNSFIRIMIRSVIFYNNYWYMKTFQKTPQMREYRVRPIPYELWNYGMQFLTGAMRVLDLNEINKVLLPREQASVTERGICFKNLYYTCDKAENEQWYERARIKRFRVTVLYDPTCVDHIYILGDSEQVITCSLVDKSALYSGATAEDNESFHDQDLKEQAEWSEHEERAKNSLIGSLKDIVEGCRKEKNGESRSSVVSRLNSLKISENRKDEISALSGQAKSMAEQQEFFEKQQSGVLEPESKEAEDRSPTADDAISKSIDAVIRKAGIKMI